MFVFVYVCLCVCVCVYMREREREIAREENLFTSELSWLRLPEDKGGGRGVQAERESIEEKENVIWISYTFQFKVILVLIHSLWSRPHTRTHTHTHAHLLDKALVYEHRLTVECSHYSSFILVDYISAAKLQIQCMSDAASLQNKMYYNSHGRSRT